MFSDSSLAYSMQYKEAFETLYLSNRAVDTIALPMMYLLRHCIELALKFNIEYFHDYSGLEFKYEHKLNPLAKGFEECWSSVKQKYTIECEDKLYFDNLKILIDKLNYLDEKSTALRYSHDKASKSIERSEKIDIFEMKNIFEGICPLLYNTVDVFDDKTGLMHGTTSKKELLDINKI